jgi:hypothetical protein
MSIAEFYIEHGLDPNDDVCEVLHRGSMRRSPSPPREVRCHHPPARPSSSTAAEPLPNPKTDENWIKFCFNLAWWYKESKEDVRFYGKRVMDSNGKKETLEAAPAPNDMHPGACAPKWVFDAVVVSKSTDKEDNIESYQRRLICALTGRFVCITEVGAMDGETLLCAKGKPRVSVRYTWRYWDNKGNVYEDTMQQYRDSVRHPDFVRGENFGGLPGDFSAGAAWMRCSLGFEGCSTRVADLWDTMWNFRFRGTTTVRIWDQCLVLLASSAGVPEAIYPKNHWPCPEMELDQLASVKGWNKIHCVQHDRASFSKDYTRLEFFLSTATATAGSCQDHLTPEETQIFQTAVTYVSALFDNPRQKTSNKKAEAATTKKRKAQSQPDRTCAQCGESRILDSFSKNQRRKGTSARCKNCV